MKLAAADWQRRGGMAELLAVLGAKAGEVRYVGGCVRDTMLGLPARDIDLATRLRPEQVIERLRRARVKSIPTGLAHGTVTAVLDGRPVEITTLRRDVATDGRRATIAYTDDWAEDAARRDFTINALSADPPSREIHDYFGGAADLAAGRVRFIGDAFTRIAEDHLRILRFFRFHARFGRGEADAEALEACIARANDLMALSRERIADELLKLLGLPDPAPTAALMVARGVLRPVLPEVDEAGTLRLARLVRRESEATAAPEPLRRLAALLPRDPELAGAVGKRLRLSNKAVKRLIAAAEGETEEAPEALAYRIGRDHAVDRILLGEGDPAGAAALAGWERPKLYIKGGDMIEMGVEVGPMVAQCFREVQRKWAEAGFPAGEEAQRSLAREAVDQALRDSQ